MKLSDILKFWLVVLIVISMISCSDVLEPDVFSEISPDLIENTEEGIDGVLNSAYAQAMLPGGSSWGWHWNPSLSSGETWNSGGGIETTMTDIRLFNFTTTNGFFNNPWQAFYNAIRDANIVLASIDNENFSSEFRSMKSAEAKFIRGFSYSELMKNFGPTPIHTSPEEVEIPRSSLEEMKARIEQDLSDAASTLPIQQNEYGRATKGAALGVLAKYYLNIKEWENAANISQEIINMNRYDLVPNYSEVFSPENEENEEMIWVLTKNAQHSPQHINALTIPTDFPMPNSNNAVWAAHNYLYDSFVNSFEEGDSRKELIVTEYVNNSGEFKQFAWK